MACETEYKAWSDNQTDRHYEIYQDCLARSERQSDKDREFQAKEAEAQRKAALYSQIHATSAKLAESRLPTQTPDYSSLLRSGAQYTAPAGAGAGFISSTTSGIGQGILIFGILAGGMLIMMLMFFMVKPKTVQQLPGFRKRKKARRKKAKKR